VEAPKAGEVNPVRVVSVAGSVSGATALLDSSRGGTAVLRMRAGGLQPTIVVDYGKDVGGVPYFIARSESGSPELNSSYSEGLRYLGATGDNAPSLSDAGDPSRTDTLIVSAPGLNTTDLIQGGERYQRISLTSPGTVSLSSMGIRFTAERAAAIDYKGWFDSSSEQLNRIWFSGAYTLQLDELPAHSVAGPWNIISGVFNGNGGAGVLRKGTRWTNYTMSFDTQIVDNEIGWLVRASSTTAGYLFLISDATTTSGTPNTLQAIAIGPNGAAPIASTALPMPINAGTGYRVQTVVSGSEISVSIGGQVVAHFATDALSPTAPIYHAGSVGFIFPGSVANVKDLVVTTPAGRTLFANTLSKTSALAAFTGGNLRMPDPLPIILDGAKRDREDWSGDLGVSAATAFYTTDQRAYVRDSLDLLARGQTADGESAGQVFPTMAPNNTPNSAEAYSATYSMEEVANIASYYLYTGDLTFVRSEWPMISRELAYDRSSVDSRGLLVTDVTNGRDWDYYDGAKSGEVTAYNDIYYETLKDASVLATALGRTEQAAALSQEAAALRLSINQFLFVPSTGLYVLSNQQPYVVAQDANSLAIDYGVAPPEWATRILSALRIALPSTPYGPLPYSATSGYQRSVSPFITDQEVQAAFSAHDTALAMSLLGAVWGHMITSGSDNTGTDWELVATDGSPGFGGFTSLAHGWSSGATADLSAYVLGVRPASAGYRSWVVQPQLGSLAWAEGDVPTPRGAIAVRWAQNGPTGRLALLVTAPRSTRGTIEVPVLTSGAVVTVRSTRPGATRPLRQSFTTTNGQSTLMFPASGGRTYLFEETRRS
jgi:alpha-L-rhamnosidase